jgi:dTDP-4-amino-4,6-dideoxygalactose transaminase
VYPVRTPNRDQLRATLAAQGIATGMHYPVPLHKQPVLARLGYRPGAFPVSEAWSREVLSLPMFAELEPHEIERAGGIATAWEATAA